MFLFWIIVTNPGSLGCLLQWQNLNFWSMISTWFKLYCVYLSIIIFLCSWLIFFFNPSLSGKYLTDKLQRLWINPAFSFSPCAPHNLMAPWIMFFSLPSSAIDKIQSVQTLPYSVTGVRLALWYYHKYTAQWQLWPYYHYAVYTGQFCNSCSDKNLPITWTS